MAVTSQLQVLVVLVNKPFKDNLYKKIHRVAAHTIWKNTEACGERILQAWAAVPLECILNGFKRCCISDALVGSEDDLL